MKSLIVTCAVVLVFIGTLEARKPEHKRFNFIERRVGKPQNARLSNTDSKRKSLMIREDDYLQKNIPHFTKGICSTPCKPHEICLTKQGAKESICVDKKKARESRRLYRKFQRKHQKGFHKENRRQWRRNKLMKRQRFHDKKAFMNNYKKWSEHFKKGHNKFSRRRFMGKEHYMNMKAHRGQFKRKNNVDRTGLLENLEVVQKLLDVNDKLGKPVCSAKKMNTLRKQLEGWFVVMHEKRREDRHQHNHAQRLRRSANMTMDEVEDGKCKCLKSVMLELHKLDTDYDHHLSKEELMPIENNHQESCITPLLMSCNADNDPRISKTEWCCCFPINDPPCSSKVKQMTSSGQIGAYLPQCTNEGYFKRMQCHGSTGYCWCSDLNGNEIKGSRLHASVGMPQCAKYDALGNLKA